MSRLQSDSHKERLKKWMFCLETLELMIESPYMPSEFLDSLSDMKDALECLFSELDEQKHVSRV